MRRVLLVVAVLAAAGAVLTGAALEGSGVAVITTTAPDGSPRETHVWYAEAGGELWLEAGHPDNPWYRDLGRHPELSLDAGRVRGVFLAEPVEDRATHAWLRARLREKYGLRDRWIGMLVDSSQSVAVRLLPLADP